MTKNVLRCKVCGVKTTYGNGWAFYRGKCKGKKIEEYPPATQYKFMDEHEWELVRSYQEN